LIRIIPRYKYPHESSPNVPNRESAIAGDPLHHWILNRTKKIHRRKQLLNGFRDSTIFSTANSLEQAKLNTGR